MGRGGAAGTGQGWGRGMAIQAWVPHGDSQPPALPALLQGGVTGGRPVPGACSPCTAALPLSTGNVINTNCSAAHSRQALSCKMAVEYDHFIASGRK